ncbi:RxLR-like protein [Plasmopara halstedii]|uniref:RxLR-like protein n=1 Tax=Plasmopara halstedii TaxID=4781 RepID=A0A0P1ASB4_PLAHL|nr:RxLR-like protein [Plasmopara halstedii]CEG44593.1 RxLR-like protein [Plasmopara halstedii]|eukprot:XP_024580962.1 RxLR-like protein [Plasmopara halstedii]
MLHRGLYLAAGLLRSLDCVQALEYRAQHLVKGSHERGKNRVLAVYFPSKQKLSEESRREFLGIHARYAK